MTSRLKRLDGFGATLSGGNMARGISILTSILLALYPVAASAQSSVIATPLPNAKQTFVDANGKPLTGGKVFSYVPNTSTPKTTWSTTDETIANANPVTLDSAGRGTIFGQGNYRQVLQDASGNTIWDSFTTAVGSTAPLGASGTDTAPVGTVMPFTGFAVPTNWALAYGQTVLRASYAQLLATLTITNAATSCVSGSPTLSGLSDTSQMAIGEPIESACLPTGTTISGIPTGTTLTVNHNATATGTFSTSVFPWGNGDGTLTFNVPDLRGRTVAGADAMGGTAASRLTSTYFGSSASAPAVAGGSQSHTLTASEAAALTFTSTVTDPGHSHGVVGNSPAGGGGAVPETGGGGGTPTLFGTNSSTTGITVATSSNAGGQAHSIVQPTLTVNYIIKLAPNSSGAGGVVSLGGMFGDIICGANLTCAAGVISATGGGGGGGISSLSAGTGITLTPNPITTVGTIALTAPVTVDLGGTGGTSFTANAPLIGAGGSALGVGSRSGNTTIFATSNGSLTDGHCVSINSGNLIDAGGPCTTGGGGGTVTAALANQLAYYAVNGTTVSGLATAANGVLITSGGSVPSISSTLPSTVQGNITALGTVSSGTWNATAVGPTKGGTGQTGYSTGDVIYASAANTLARLAGNTSTAKQYLQQAGTGVSSAAPTWSAVDLATGVTGNLGVANLNGGTGASSSTYWRGDGTWATAAGGGGNVTGTGSANTGAPAIYSSTATTAIINGKSPVNALAYGADPSGVSDSTSAINTALAAGVAVYLPAGTYKISSCLNFPNADGVSLIGAGSSQGSNLPPTGSGTTTLTSNSSSGSMVCFHNGVSGATLANINLTRSVTPVSGCGVDAMNYQGVSGVADGTYIYNVYVLNNYDGICLGAIGLGRVTWVRSAANVRHGIFMSPNSANPLQWIVNDAYMAVNGGDGMQILNTIGQIVAMEQFNNIMTFNNNGWGIRVLGSSGSPLPAFRLIDSFLGDDKQGELFLDTFQGQHILTHVYTELAGAAAFAVNSFQFTASNHEVSMTNCIAINAGSAGVLTSAHDLTINGGYFLNNGIVGGNPYGILSLAGNVTINGARIGNTWTGSAYSGTQTFGVVTSAGVYNSSIVGTNFQGNLTSATSIGYTGTNYAAGNF